MRRLLLPTDKHLHFEFDPQRHTHIITLRHSLRFTYIVQSVTMHLAHPQLQILLQYLVIHMQNDSRQRQLTPTTYISKLQPDETLKATIVLDDAQLNTLEFVFTLSTTNLNKLTQLINQIKLTRSRDDSNPAMQIQQVLSFCYLDCQLNGFDIEIFQPIDSGIQLINLSQRLMRQHRYAQAHLVSFHVAMIAKHKSKWKQAQQTLLSLYNKVDGQFKKRILLNLVDTALDSKTKIEYIQKMSETQFEIRPSTIFRQCGLLLQNVFKNVDINNFMDFCCFLSIVTYFINQVGCTIGDSLVWIFQNIISVFSNKKFWKRLKNQNQQNFMLAISSVDLLFQGINCCALSFSPQYVSQLSYFLLDYAYTEETTLIRRPIIMLVHSFMKQQVSSRLAFRQWFSILYYIEGDQLLKHIDIDGKFYSGKQARQQITLLEEQIKSTVLYNLAADSLKQFISILGQHLVRMALAHQINFLVLHHFLQLVNIFTVSCSQHNKDIKPDLLSLLLPLYKPLKMLINRMIDMRLQPVSVFNKAWDIFVQLCTAISDITGQSLLQVIINIVTRHVLKSDVNMHDIPYLPIVCDNLHNYTTHSQQYAEMAQCTIIKVAKMLRNSIHTESIYSLLQKLIVFRPQLLSDQNVMTNIVACLCDPYTDQDQRWKIFINSLCQRLVSQPTLQPTLQYLISSNNIRKNKQSQQDAKLHQQRSVRKLHVLSRLLKVCRDVGSPAISNILFQSTEQLIGSMRKQQQMRQLNIQFHRFYCISKHLSLTANELGSAYFQLFQMQYPPIVYSCLVLMASNRKLVPKQQYDSHFKVAMTEVSSPWKNIQEISLLLLAYFACPDNTNLPSVLTQLLSADQVYKRLIGLSIVNNMADHFSKLSSSSRYTSDIPQLISNISPCLTQLSDSYSIKQLQLVVYYVYHKLCQLFRLKQRGVYLLTEDDQVRLKEVLSLQERIESIVSREFSKDAEDYIKSQVSLPRKAENQEKTMDQEVEIIQEVKKVDNGREIHSGTTSAPTPTVPSTLPFPKQITKTPPPQPSKPRQVMAIRKELNKQSSKTKTKPVQHGSPIVQIESSHREKFKINLGHLKDKWRQSLQMIHKKPKSRKKT